MMAVVKNKVKPIEGKKEKPVPICCLCGRVPAIVKFRSKKMVSCSDPMNCTGNYRTEWTSSEDAAIAEWNTLIKSDRRNR